MARVGAVGKVVHPVLDAWSGPPPGGHMATSCWAAGSSCPVGLHHVGRPDHRVGRPDHRVLWVYITSGGWIIVSGGRISAWSGSTSRRWGSTEGLRGWILLGASEEDDDGIDPSISSRLADLLYLGGRPVALNDEVDGIGF